MGGEPEITMVDAPACGELCADGRGYGLVRTARGMNVLSRRTLPEGVDPARPRQVTMDSGRKGLRNLVGLALDLPRLRVKREATPVRVVFSAAVEGVSSLDAAGP